MALLALLTLVTLPAATHQLTFSKLRTLETTELAAELSARRTLAGAASLIDSLEADMARLSQALRPHSSASLVQLTSELSSTNSSQAPPSPVKPVVHKKGIDAATAVKEMAGLKPAQMPAMLGLLTGMYDSWKDKIGEANKKEHKDKTAYEQTIKDLEAKKAMYKDSKDATSTYDRIEKYWKKQRAISHRQYHTALKIMHSGMQKFKAVSSAMKSAIAGKKPTAKDLQTVGMAMPDVVFLELARCSVWTQRASENLRRARGLSGN